MLILFMEHFGSKGGQKRLQEAEVKLVFKKYKVRWPKEFKCIKTKPNPLTIDNALPEGKESTTAALVNYP
jgi:hypothetical protein